MSTAKSGGFVPIPASAFDSPAGGGSLGRAFVPGGGVKGERSIEAWRKTKDREQDPGVSRLEGMLSMHVELEKERMKSLVGEGRKRS